MSEVSYNAALSCFATLISVCFYYGLGAATEAGAGVDAAGY